MDHAHPLTDRLRYALDAMGLDSTVDADGDLEVEFEGNALFIHVAEDDSAFRVFGRWEVSVEEDGGEGSDESGNADELELLRRCNEVNLELLLVKVALHEGDLVFSVDHALDPATPDAPLDAVLPHLMENLLHGVETFTASE
jgi:hypothetical protein